jgi:hypothetical protein
MSTKEIILIVIAFAALGFSLYRRFNKKDKGARDSQSKPSSISSFSSSSQDDDYEPYSNGKSQE